MTENNVYLALFEKLSLMGRRGKTPHFLSPFISNLLVAPLRLLALTAFAVNLAQAKLAFLWALFRGALLHTSQETEFLDFQPFIRFQSFIQ
jgi:hypothetical protein